MEEQMVLKLKLKPSSAPKASRVPHSRVASPTQTKHDRRRKRRVSEDATVCQFRSGRMSTADRLIAKSSPSKPVNAVTAVSHPLICPTATSTDTLSQSARSSGNSSAKSTALMRMATYSHMPLRVATAKMSFSISPTIHVTSRAPSSLTLSLE